MASKSQLSCGFWSQSSYGQCAPANLLPLGLSYPVGPSHLVASLSSHPVTFDPGHPVACLFQPSYGFLSWPSCGQSVPAILWPACFSHPMAFCPSHHVACLSQPSCGQSVPATLWPACHSHPVASLPRPSCGRPVSAILWLFVLAIMWPFCPSHPVACLSQPSCGQSVPAILWPVCPSHPVACSHLLWLFSRLLLLWLPVHVRLLCRNQRL